MANRKISIPEAFQDLWTPARFKVYHGGRGGAKSESIGRYLLIEGLKEPQNIVCGREFQKSIKESVHSMLASIIDVEGLSGEYDVLDAEIRSKNGTRFTFVGLHHNLSNIKSMHNIKRFWGEEAQVFSDQTLKVLSPTIRAEGSELIFSMNPELEEDPSYQQLIANPLPGSIVRAVNYWDNPYFPDVLRMEMEHMKKTNYEEYLHIWEGKPRAAIQGAIFARELERAQAEGRILEVPYNHAFPVDCFLDLGWSDQTAIWFGQVVGFQNRFLHYYANSHEKAQHYIAYMKELSYAYGSIYLPHDAEHEQLGQEKTIKAQFEAAFPGINVQVIPRVLSKANSIEAARVLLANSYFDKSGCADGLTALRRYAYKVDPQTNRVSKEPDHNIWSNGADAYQTAGMAMQPSSFTPTYTAPSSIRTPRLG